MRFHLPAFLIAELKNEFQFDIWFHLTHLSEYKESQFELLDAEQRLIVEQLYSLSMTYKMTISIMITFASISCREVTEVK
ncbi:MAG: hypothetical protein B0W54_12800 [Cellvibrio sp. 79]|nr:MAG: hypothetical protein B0W54_12800 [Cellvibrio sp. 79]